MRALKTKGIVEDRRGSLKTQEGCWEPKMDAEDPRMSLTQGEAGDPRELLKAKGITEEPRGSLNTHRAAEDPRVAKTQRDH